MDRELKKIEKLLFKHMPESQGMFIKLLLQWHSLIQTEIISGYRSSLQDEWLHDLGVRILLQNIIDSANTELSDLLIYLIEPIDETYFSNTIEMPTKIYDISDKYFKFVNRSPMKTLKFNIDFIKSRGFKEADQIEVID
jgi:hypothetical protein